MRLFLVLAAVVVLGCAAKTENGDPTGSGSGGMGNPEPFGERTRPLSDQCTCLPDCAVSVTDIENTLCGSANGSLVVRSTYGGCDDVEYADIWWNVADSYRIAENTLAGCTSSTLDGSSSSADATLSATCNPEEVLQCAVCPEVADPFLRMNYSLKTCEATSLAAVE